HPLVYATSKNFMDYFGINSPEDLPKIREILADQVVDPTVIHHTDFEQSELLAVADNGELVANGDDASSETYINGHAFENADAPIEEIENEVDSATNDVDDSG